MQCMCELIWRMNVPSHWRFNISIITQLLRRYFTRVSMVCVQCTHTEHVYSSSCRSARLPSATRSALLKQKNGLVTQTHQKYFERNRNRDGELIKWKVILVNGFVVVVFFFRRNCCYLICTQSLKYTDTRRPSPTHSHTKLWVNSILARAWLLPHNSWQQSFRLNHEQGRTRTHANVFDDA